MCVVVPRSSWQGGPAARPPLHPLRQSGAHLPPIPTQPTSPGSRMVTWLWVRGRLRTGGNDWPLHHQSGGAFLLLPTPAMTGETSALPWTPSTLHADTCSGIAEGACLPLGTQPLPRGQPSVDWMPAMVSPMETTKGLPAPLWTPAANHTPVGGRLFCRCARLKTCEPNSARALLLLQLVKTYVELHSGYWPPSIHKRNRYVARRKVGDTPVTR